METKHCLIKAQTESGYSKLMLIFHTEWVQTFDFAALMKTKVLLKVLNFMLLITWNLVQMFHIRNIKVNLFSSVHEYNTNSVHGNGRGQGRDADDWQQAETNVKYRQESVEAAETDER